MNKKVIIIASAVLAFFAGAIWVSEVPVVATLVAFLEVCAGFGCGFFFCKELVKEEQAKLVDEVNSLKLAQKALAEEKKPQAPAKKKVATNKAAPKE